VTAEAAADLADAVRRAPIVIGTTPDRFVAFLTGTGTSAGAGAGAGPGSEGHLTAIAWVFDPARRHVLLVRHRLHGCSCAGGHVEPGESPQAAARRELREETGIDAAVASTVPLTVASAIGCARGDGIRHWTVGYAFEVGRDVALRPEADQPVRWFPLERPPSPRAPDIDIVVDHLRR
jgi:8-oxo-dGTP diphosphatase